MATKMDGNSLVSVRNNVTTAGGAALTTNTSIEVYVKQLLIAALESVPNQAAGSATIGAIVTALKTIPDPA